MNEQIKVGRFTINEILLKIKTLEEKIEFIMENGEEIDRTNMVKLKSLQDLWEDKNKEHLEKELIKEFIKPTVKECDHKIVGKCPECDCYIVLTLTHYYRRMKRQSKKLDGIL